MRRQRGMAAAGLAMLAVAAGDGPAMAESNRAAADTFLIVDCLLPPQVRRLGSMTYAAARPAARISAQECEARGGEYVAYDRASAATTLKVWLPLAEQGDPHAQTLVGETFERGPGGTPDYAAAAAWYLKAAEQNHAAAALNLGRLFEEGKGLQRDPGMANFWYRRAAGLESAAPEPAPAAPAAITIVEPELTVIDGKSYAASRGAGALVVVGQVETAAMLAKVEVNDQPARVLPGNLFRATLDAATLGAYVTVAAYDTTGRPVGRMAFKLGLPEITAGPAAAVPAALTRGRAHALVIGNNNYLRIPRLDTAVADARAVADILRSQYGFSVTMLLDVDRYTILSALNDLRTRFGPDDQLLIYYAGHGELDQVNQRGHWLPVDAEADNLANWISILSITDMLNAVPARRLMVIADSCYSGTMTRTAFGALEASTIQRRLELLAASAGSRTRTVLTSGGVQPVIDGIDGRHSIFAHALLDVLKNNTGLLTGLDLYQQVAPKVRMAARKVGFQQEPDYAPVKFAGHEGGDFVLVRKK